MKEIKKTFACNHYAEVEIFCDSVSEFVKNHNLFHKNFDREKTLIFNDAKNVIKCILESKFNLNIKNISIRCSYDRQYKLGCVKEIIKFSIKLVGAIVGGLESGPLGSVTGFLIAECGSIIVDKICNWLHKRREYKVEKKDKDKKSNDENKKNYKDGE